MGFSNDARHTVLISVLLALITAGLYLPVLQHEFINYDDPEYLTQNAVVQKGLTGDGIIWAFSGSHSGNWHPLTWVSHMLDAQIYGRTAGGHHLTNVLFHAANTVLLFLFLRSATEAMWRSACVAALFGIHPLHVESVAWVAERKDVLSGFFGLLTLWAYCRYAQESKAQSPKSKVFYVLALGLLGAGLMSKPMLVTWPFLMLLLDFWPLERLKPFPREFSIAGKLWFEKIPFLLLALGSCLMTLWAQEAGGAVVSLDGLTFSARVENALISYAAYLKNTLWPVNLAVFYPHGEKIAWDELTAAALLIGLISIYAALHLNRRPWLTTGWLWYLGTLIPVLGLVQVGIQSHADRYTYLPLIGIFIMSVWGVENFVSEPPYRKVLPACAILILATCAILSSFQLSYWTNTKTLFSHAREVTKGNSVAATVLGEEFAKEKNYEEALRLFQEALSYRPNYLDARLCYGQALIEQAKYKEAADNFGETIAMAPDSAQAHFGLASALAFQRRFPDAIDHYMKALQLKPDYWQAQLDLAHAEMASGKFTEAYVQLDELVSGQPTNVQAQFTLGSCLNELGRTNEARQHYDATLSLDPAFADKLLDSAKALASTGEASAAIARLLAVLNLKPGCADAHGEVGLLLAQRGEIGEAIPHFTEAVRLRPDAQAHYSLALALNLQGNTTAAIEQYRLALNLKPDWPTALNDLAWILATHKNPEVRNGAEAVRLAEKACSLSENKEARFLGTLDAAYAETGRFADAISTARKARQIALGSGQHEIAEAAAARINLYQKRQAYRQP